MGQVLVLKLISPQLYKYNEDNFSIKVLIVVNKLFSNYKFTSNQRDAVLLTASLDLYVYVNPCCLTA